MNRIDEAVQTSPVAHTDLPPPTHDADPTPTVQPPRPPQPPAKERRTGALRRWRARFVVLLMLAVAVYGGDKLVQSRAHAAAQLGLGTVTLTAEPIPVQSDQLGLVRSVSVKAHQQVVAGQELGRLAATTMTGAGHPVRSTVVLRAPVTGIVSDDPKPVGSALQPGDAFVDMYQPTKLTLVADVALRDLPRLAPGMRATLHGADLPTPIEATLGQTIPRVGGEQSNVEPDHIAVQLVPTDRRLVAQLVPGLRFEGTVDTTSVPPGKRQSVYVGQ
jgi:multidrug resistance efflux pump